MPTTRTATAIAVKIFGRAPVGVPAPFHLAAAAWVVGMLGLAAAAPENYRALLQEDHFVEWWTVGLFAAAGAVRAVGALRERRAFDLLVALFCLFVAGEEFSWGQRLLGFVPPQPFLEHNAQQEFTLHNFAVWFGEPRGVLIVALVGYGLVLPALWRTARGRRLMSRAGASPPPLQAVPWFAAAALLLFDYPVEYTGEWVEVLAGALFLASVARARTLWRGSLGAAAAAAVLTVVSARGAQASTEQVACAGREAEALLADIVRGGAARAKLVHGSTVHKRVWTAVQDRYLDADRLTSFRSVPCAEQAAARRRVGVDPWGMAYWIRTEWADGGARTVTVYSMGPNRRRDGAPGEGVGDDVAVVGMLGEDAAE